MPIARALHCSTSLNSTNVFVFGGKTFHDMDSAVAHVYDFQTEQWSLVGI